MAKQEWKLIIGNQEFNMVVHNEIQGELISVGTIIKNNKFLGTFTTKTPNFLKKPKKPKKAEKSYAYMLAHHLASEFFTGGKIGMADQLVMECFSLTEDRGVRSARKKYTPPKTDSICSVGRTLKSSAIIFFMEPEKLILRDDSVVYEGDAIYWHGSLTKAVFGRVVFTGTP